MVPDEVGALLGAQSVHRRGITGSGVVVAMPDTGFYPHLFFKDRGFRHLPTLLAGAATDPDQDLSGHGTGEAANIFSAAPDATLLPIKNDDPVDAIKLAVTDGAQVITKISGATTSTILASRGRRSIPI